MMAKKTSMDLDLVLPDIPDEQDACVGRLTALLEAGGLEKAHLIHEQGTALLCLHYDPERLSVHQVRGLVKASGADLARRYRHESLSIEGMERPGNAGLIEQALQAMPGVLEAAVSYGSGRLRLEFDADMTGHEAVIERLHDLGYEVVEGPGHAHEHAHEHGHEHDEHEHGSIELKLSIAAGLLLVTGWLLGLTVAPAWLSLALFLGAYAAGGWFAVKEAWQGLRSGNFDIDTLMIVAAVGAAALGQWAEGALLLVLFSLGHALEHRAMDRARRAIEALADLAPKTARVQRDGDEVEVPPVLSRLPC